MPNWLPSSERFTVIRPTIGSDSVTGRETLGLGTILGAVVGPGGIGVETSVDGDDGDDVTGYDATGAPGRAVAAWAGSGPGIGLEDEDGAEPKRKKRPRPRRPGSSPAPHRWPTVTIKRAGATRVIPARDFQPGCIADLLTPIPKGSYPVPPPTQPSPTRGEGFNFGSLPPC